MIYFTFSNSKKNKYLGHEIHAVSERCDEPNGGVPVEGGQLLLPHQPVDVPINILFILVPQERATDNRQVKKKPSKWQSDKNDKSDTSDKCEKNNKSDKNDK